MLPKLRILFLCTGNSCRSQMAEGWARALYGERFEVHSAGLEAHGLDPRAVGVMGERGVDISRQVSKTLDELEGAGVTRFDWVITVCGDAHERCPLFPGPARVVHVGFEDPPRLAADAADEIEALDHYRRVRDEIEAFVRTLPPFLQSAATVP